eukprot:TRINITY_DN112715_c0_g1_i1.p1 TRINITY_DN112715_c0_g1~~TRINITY_DN112715_c0_g1_i1.p1  ORF type:complete len:599 (-),score=125.12 TRINITY_DN112715_c0_g1_i1:128-1924(-)
MSFYDVENRIRADCLKEAHARLDDILARSQKAEEAPSREEADNEIVFCQKLQQRARGRRLGFEDKLDKLRRLRESLQSSPRRGGYQASGGSSSSSGSPRRGRPQTSSYRDGTVTAVANYLHTSEEEVALRAAGGELSSELANSMCISRSRGDAEAGSSMILIRSDAMLRSWTIEDDDRLSPSHRSFQDERTRTSILELNDDVAKLVSAFQELGEIIEADRENLDSLEESRHAVRQNVEEGVRALIKAKHHNTNAVKWVVPVALGVIVGIVTASGGVLAGVAAGGATAGVTAVGTHKLAEWQERSLNLLRQQLPSAMMPLTSEESARVSVLADEIQERFLDVLLNSEWHRQVLSMNAAVTTIKAAHAFQVFYTKTRQAPIQRTHENAYKSEFEVDLSPREAFAALQKLNVSQGGALDPGCMCNCNLPIRGMIGNHDSEGKPEPTTAVRLSVYSSTFFNRDFFSLNRTGCVTVGGKDRYIIAFGSVPATAQLPASIPRPEVGVKHGEMYAAGVMVDAVESPAGGQDHRRCRVTVLADVDPQVGTIGVGRQVRMRVLTSASHLYAELQKISKALEPGPQSPVTPMVSETRTSYRGAMRQPF